MLARNPARRCGRGFSASGLPPYAGSYRALYRWVSCCQLSRPLPGRRFSRKQSERAYHAGNTNLRGACRRRTHPADICLRHHDSVSDLTHTAPAPPSPVFATSGTISGVVFERTAAGPASVAGVEVFCHSCDHAVSFTDAQGVYRFDAVPNGLYDLWVAKRGYTVSKSAAPTGGWSGRVDVRVTGDTRVDIELVRQ